MKLARNHADSYSCVISPHLQAHHDRQARVDGARHVARHPDLGQHRKAAGDAQRLHQDCIPLKLGRKVRQQQRVAAQACQVALREEGQVGAGSRVGGCSREITL
jgi:hypothetical protein